MTQGEDAVSSALLSAHGFTHKRPSHILEICCGLPTTKKVASWLEGREWSWKMPATGFQLLVFVSATATSFQLKVWGLFGVMLSLLDLLRCLVSVQRMGDPRSGLEVKGRMISEKDTGRRACLSGVSICV